jgi:Spy/CpxP family protein refolding chaperone
MDTEARSPRQTNRKAVVWLFVVFALGIALGVLGTYVVTTRVFAHGQPPAHNPASGRAHYIDRLNRELNLTPDEQKQIDAILTTVQARFDAIHESVVPQYEDARKSGREQIRQLLTPDQQTKFDDFLRRMDEEHKNHPPGGPGGN